jgi:hypothetical protein
MATPCQDGYICFYPEENFNGENESFRPTQGDCANLTAPAMSVRNSTSNAIALYSDNDCEGRESKIQANDSMRSLEFPVGSFRALAGISTRVAR